MPRRSSHLVCQFLENVSRELLAAYQDAVRAYVSGPGRHGVYALYRRGRLYYVGLATNLRSRLTAHLKDQHAGSWDRFSLYVTTTDEHIRELEALLLRIVKPEGNRQKGKFRRAENLRIRLGKDLRRLDRERLNEMLGRRGPNARAKPHKEPGRRTRTRLPRTISVRGERDGETFRARLRPDGRVFFRGKLYDNPAKAAKAATGRNLVGRAFWTYQRAPGQWAKIRELMIRRKRSHR